MKRTKKRKRIRVHCKACDHVARRAPDLVDAPCTMCGSKRVHVRPKGNPLAFK